MKTLKIGSKGDEVKTLQKLLNKEGYNLVVDSDFGQKTHDALVAWQKAHGLVADGIVGPKTWAALGVKETGSTSSKCVDPSVVYAPLDCCVSKSPNRNIKFLAIHYTAGASSAPGKAESMKDSWELKRRASADFGVDDANMVQFNPDLKNYHCWSVGDAKKTAGGGAQLFGKAINRNTISIEMCSNLTKGYNHNAVNHDGWYFTEATLDNAVKLAKILMNKFNIPIERVVRHYDISGKICPGVVGWNNYVLFDKDGKRIGKQNDSTEWENFKKRLV